MAKSAKASQTQTQKAKPMAKASQSKAVVPSFVDAKALAPKGEGEKVARALCAASAQIDVLEQKLSVERGNKGAALAAMTALFIKAGQSDKRLQFAVANGDDKKAKNILFDRCRAVLGIIEVNTNADGTETRTQAVWADELFPRIGETAKNSQDGSTFTARETNRSNFTARIREACKAAYGALDKGITAEIDKTSGLLAISGKAVREHFNQDKVILNEKQSFTVDGKDVTLKAKPSISELARMGGAVVTRQRAGGAPQVNPANNEQVAAQVAKWQAIVEKLGRFDDTVATALDNLVDAIDEAKERNEKLAAAA